MIRYYRERNGDYLAVDTDTRSYYLATFGRDEYQGRAAALSGLATSVCTCGIGGAYLRACCKPVPEADVPPAWRQAIGFEGLPVVWSEGPQGQGEVAGN